MTPLAQVLLDRSGQIQEYIGALRNDLLKIDGDLKRIAANHTTCLNLFEDAKRELRSLPNVQAAEVEGGIQFLDKLKAKMERIYEAGKQELKV